MEFRKRKNGGTYRTCAAPGILYITNQRIVFQATEWGFDKTYRYLTAITPYSNACELQFGNKSYCMVVANGNITNQVLQLIKQRRNMI